MNIFGKLREKGFDTVPESFYTTDIVKWQSWYKGNVKGFHDYQVYNGLQRVKCHRYTMNMGKKVAQDWANLLMNEKVKITLEGRKEQEFFDKVCTDNNFAVKINEMQEMKAALGTAAYVARVSGAVADERTGELRPGGEIKLDYVTATGIFPLSWENSIATECAFTSSRTINGEKYLYLQIHYKGEDGLYIIENSLYTDREGELAEVDMQQVKGFQRVQPIVYTKQEKPLFVLDRLTIANNVDETLPMGIPAFANAIDNLEAVDKAFDGFVNEFVLGKKRLMIKPEAIKGVDGELLFDPNDVLFYTLPEDSQSQTIITPIDMPIRAQEYIDGMQDALNKLGSNCGFGENHYQYDRTGVTTATQIVSENSTLFRTIKKHETILEQVLKDLCRIILRLGNSALRLGLNEDVEISIDFDDSIIEDKQSDFTRDMQLLNAGIMNDWEFRMKWMNEDEATAKAALPRMEDMTDEKQGEVE